MARNLKSEGAARYHNLFNFLIIRQVKIIDSEVILKTHFSLLLKAFDVPSIKDFPFNQLTSIQEVTPRKNPSKCTCLAPNKYVLFAIFRWR
jgi:hypothetical protein